MKRNNKKQTQATTNSSSNENGYLNRNLNHSTNNNNTSNNISNNQNNNLINNTNTNSTSSVLQEIEDFRVYLQSSNPNHQSMQSQNLNINMDNYGYSVGNQYPEIVTQNIGPVSDLVSEQGLSPPYSNQSPPYSVQSNIALSPHGYIGNNLFINIIYIII